MAYSPSAGGQQREIGERMYVISYQDFTEVVGGVARGFYEKAVRNFYRELKQSKELRQLENYSDRARALGVHYIKVAEAFKLSLKHKATVLKERALRSLLVSELGTQRQAKAQELVASEPSSREHANIRQQIRDMDLIMLQYADDFDLYHAKNRKDLSDYSPLDPEKDYFYRVKRNGNTLQQAVIPDIRVQPIVSLTYTQEIARRSAWKDLISKSGSLDVTGWQQGQLKEIEPGRFINLNRLPEEAMRPWYVQS